MLIEYFGETGKTIYAILRAATGSVLNPATLELEEVVVPVDHTTYAIALTEDANISGRYIVDISVGSVATYVCEYWEQTGGSADRGADIRLGSVSFYWDSEKEWDTESVSGLAINNNNGNNNTDGFLDEDRRKLRELYNLRLRSRQ